MTNQIKKNIAIITGGDSIEKEISRKSGKYFLENLDKTKYSGYQILISGENWKILNTKNNYINKKDFSFIIDNTKKTFDAVIMLIHGEPGETGDLCDYFESLNIPYSSSNKTASKLTFNKYDCNKFLKSNGYHVPCSIIDQKGHNIGYPCIVKPIGSGSSYGVSKVNSKDELDVAIELAKKYGSSFLIEEFIKGRELTCAVHNFTTQKIETLPITEIISKNEIFDYNAKYLGESEEITPAKIEKNISIKIQEISKNAYKTLKLNGIVRFDFIVKDKDPYIIEVNTIPGFSKESIVPQMINASGQKISNFISNAIQKLL